MFKKKYPDIPDRRKRDRRKPGDRRFSGRLVGKLDANDRRKERRSGRDRRKK